MKEHTIGTIDQVDLRSKLKTKEWIVFLTLGLTLLAFIESLRSFIWSPFIVLYTAIIFAIPLYLKSYSFGSFRKSWQNWKPIVLCLLAIKLWQTVYQLVYDYFLKANGVLGNPQYDLFKATNVLLNQTADKYHSVLVAALLMGFTVFIIPFAEELYYRGYVFGLLRRNSGFLIAALASSFLLAMRHFAHLLFIQPFPVVPACIWVISVIPIGVGLAYVYDRTQSLYPVILIHFLLNLPILPR